MITYKQYLESSSIRHVAKDPDKAGNIYYTNEFGRIHREDGPALIRTDGTKEWYLENDRVLKHKNIPEAIKWSFLLGDPESIKVIRNPSLRMQEYIVQVRPDLIEEISDLNPNISVETQERICKKRPDLINKIKFLDPSLKVKYAHELELAGLDI